MHFVTLEILIGLYGFFGRFIFFVATGIFAHAIEFILIEKTSRMIRQRWHFVDDDFFETGHGEPIAHARSQHGRGGRFIIVA
jgi:hypothetical protein